MTSPLFQDTDNHSSQLWTWPSEAHAIDDMGEPQTLCARTESESIHHFPYPRPTPIRLGKGQTCVELRMEKGVSLEGSQTGGLQDLKLMPSTRPSQDMWGWREFPEAPTLGKPRAWEGWNYPAVTLEPIAMARSSSSEMMASDASLHGRANHSSRSRHLLLTGRDQRFPR